MKTILAASLLLAMGLSLFGQGTVAFSTRFGADVDAPVKRPDGTGAGAGITAQLVLVTAAAELVPLTPTTTFHTTPADLTYYVNPMVLTIPGVPVGSKVSLRLRAYSGTDYATASLRGESRDVTVILGGGIILPPGLIGLQGFTLSSGGSVPVITTNPLTQPVAVGSTLTLSVGARSPTPMTYRWQWNEADIAGVDSANLLLSNLKQTDSGRYRVVVSNSAGSVTSQVAVVTVLLPPQLIGPVANQAVPVGSDVAFSVQASGDALVYQWQHSGTNLPGATAASLKLPKVRLSDAGKYQVVVSNPVGKVTASATLAVQGTSLVKRVLPVGYAPGVKLVVALQTSPSPQTLAYVLQDQLPDGWIAGTISDNGVFDPLTKKVKFGPFFDSTSRTLTYEATPPSQATAPAHFAGTATADGVSSLIIGDDSISVLSVHPADINPADQRISDVELTAYGAAWKRGETWPQGPNPIPASYVSRAGFLWRGGEAYKVDPTVTSGAPLWWVNSGVVAKPVGPLAYRPAGEHTDSEDIFSAIVPDRYVPGLPITVKSEVNPPPGTLSYVVEELVPAGWTVSNINENGAYESTSHKVKWGLFVDGTQRELSFEILAPSTSIDPIQITGVASIDGQDVPLTGETNSTSSSKLSHPQRNDHGGVDLSLTGAAGQTFVIEVSTDLIHWTVLKTVQNLTGFLHFEDSDSALLKTKFFRTVNPP